MKSWTGIDLDDSTQRFAGLGAALAPLPTNITYVHAPGKTEVWAVGPGGKVFAFSFDEAPAGVKIVQWSETRLSFYKTVATIAEAAKRPLWKSPVVLGGAALAVGGLGYFALKKKRGVGVGGLAGLELPAVSTAAKIYLGIGVAWAAATTIDRVIKNVKTQGYYNYGWKDWVLEPAKDAVLWPIRSFAVVRRAVVGGPQHLPIIGQFVTARPRGR